MKQTVVLPLEERFGTNKIYLNTAAVRYDGGAVLVDTGLPGCMKMLEALMTKEGMKLENVRKIVITHHDGDHIGGLKELVDRYPGIEVLCTGEQAPYITGKERPLRLQLAEKRYAACTSAEEKRELEEDMKRLSELETVERVTVVGDGQVLPECGIEFVEVSGHMPGHLCVYVPADKCLVTGDALTARDGVLCPPDPNFTLDMPAAVRSLKKLLDYDIENIVCYQGGIVTNKNKKKMKKIIGSGM